MARPRRKPETAYERRIRRYLEAHPGATRQQARGKRSGEYGRRVRNAERLYPGISKRGAAGRPTADEKQAIALHKAIRRADPDTEVFFIGLDRQADGTWRRAGFDLINGEMLSFEFGGAFDSKRPDAPDALRMLPGIADAIAARGLAVIGGKYLADMVDWVKRQLFDDEEDEAS